MRYGCMLGWRLWVMHGGIEQGNRESGGVKDTIRDHAAISNCYMVMTYSRSCLQGR